MYDKYETEHNIDCPIVIRRATLDNAEDIQEIMEMAFFKYVLNSNLTSDQAKSLEALQESIDDIKNDIVNLNVFIAFLDNVPVSSVRVEFMDDGSAVLKRFGVRSGYNNKGIGFAMMSFIDKIMAENKIKRLFLHTASRNSNLVRFYYGRGFFIDSVSNERGYHRALMVKEY